MTLCKLVIWGNGSLKKLAIWAVCHLGDYGRTHLSFELGWFGEQIGHD